MNEHLLEVFVRHIPITGLDVLLYALFGVFGVSLSSCLADFGQGCFGSHVCDVASVNLARILAILLHVAWFSLARTAQEKEAYGLTIFATVATDHGRLLRAIFNHVARLVAESASYRFRVRALGAAVPIPGQ